MTRAKGWLYVLGAAWIVALLACGGSSFCPDCSTAIPVTSAGYPATLPELVQGTTYAFQPAPRGGMPTSYLLGSGTLPSGLTLNPATGLISGTPDQPGVFPVSIHAANPAGGTDQALTFLVRPNGVFTVTYQTNLTFPAGIAIPDPGQVPTLANDIPGLDTTYSLGATTLPPGLALGANGAITGTPTTVGADFTFTVTAVNGSRTASCDVAYTISPAGSLILNYFNVPAATTVGTAFGPLTPTISNVTPGPSPTYAVTTGTLPPGLALNGTTGALSGTPTAAASYSFTITASNGARHADAPLTVLVVPAPAAASLVPGTATPAFGATVALTPTFSGGTATIGTTGVGSSNVSAAATSGTPVTSGPITAATTFTLTVTNVAGAQASATCTVTPQTVSGSGISPANPNVTAGLTQAFTATFTGGATGTATWTATGGSFAGNVWTAPVTPGPYTITATSVDDPSKTFSTVATVVATPAGGISASTTNPPYGATNVTVTPTMTAGTTITVGTSQGGTQISSNATPGTPIGVQTGGFTTATTYWARISNAAGSHADYSVAVTPQTVTVTKGSGVTSATVSTGYPYSATVSGASSSTLDWTATGGSFSPTSTTSGGTTTWTAPAGAGTYTVTATSASGSGSSTSWTVTVVAAPAGGISASTTNPPFGATNVTVTPTMTAGTTITVGTSQGGTQISSNATSGTPIGVQTGGFTTATTYWARITNAAGSHVDYSVAVTPQTTTVTKGSGVTSATVSTGYTFSATVSGASSSTLDWTATGGSFSPTSTTSGGATTWTAPAGAGTYTVTATSASDSGSSTSWTVTVVAAPAGGISASTTNPPYGATNVTVTPTMTAGTTITVGTSQGGTEISSNATSGTPIGVQPGGFTTATTYWARITNAAGSHADYSVAVTPQTVTVTKGSGVTSATVSTGYPFSATVSGASSSTLNWTATGGSFSPTSTTSGGTTTWTAPAGAGTYTVTATSASGSGSSTSWTVTVVAAPAGGISASTTNPPYGATNVTVTPTMTAGTTITVGTSQGGTEISSNATPGTPIGVQTGGFTTATTYWARITNAAGSHVDYSVAVAPTAVQISAISPAAPIVGAGLVQPFSVTVSGGALNSVTWSADGGSFSGNVFTGPGTNDTTWTAPLTSNTYHLTATSDDNPSVTATTTAIVNNGQAGPVIILGPIGTFAGSGTSGGGTRSALALATPLDAGAAGSAGTFAVTAAGPGPLAYQWFRIPAGSGATGLQNPVGSGSAGLTLDAAATQAANDGDRYFVLVSNASGQAVSASAPLAVGNGILLQASGQPKTAFAAAGSQASFTVTVTSADPGALQYQWYACAPGATAFTAIPGATAATCTVPAVQASDSGTLYRCVVTSLDPGVFPATTRDAALFVDTPGTLGGLADGWHLNGDAVVSGSGLQLSAAAPDQAGSAFWPQPVSTARLTLAFTVAVDNPSPVPGDGFALVFADPSRGATAASLGASGSGLGARGIPGAVLAIDTLANAAQGAPGQAGYLPADPPVPFLGLGRAEAGLWGQPWQLGYFALPGYPGSRTDPASAIRFATSSHAYRVTVADGVLSVTLDGAPVLTGAADLPPAALVGFTAATSANWERVVVSDFSATLSVP